MGLQRVGPSLVTEKQPLTWNGHLGECFQSFSKYGKMQEFRFIINFLMKIPIWRLVLSIFPEYKLPHPDLQSEFLCRLITALVNNLIILELDGGQHSLFYNLFPFVLNCNQALGGILWPICPKEIGMLIPRSGEDFMLLLDKALLIVNRTCLDCLSYYSVMAWEMVSSYHFFPYLELYYQDHWPYRTIYLVNLFKFPNH